MSDPRRWMAWLAGLWLGLLICVAAIATPAPFATLAKAEAGRVVALVLAREAAASLSLGAMLLLLQRASLRRDQTHGRAAPQVDRVLILAAIGVFCTLAGYYALQPMMVEARTGQGALSFGQLHALSAGFYIVKMVAVAVLAFGLTRARASLS